MEVFIPWKYNVQILPAFRKTFYLNIRWRDEDTNNRKEALGIKFVGAEKILHRSGKNEQKDLWIHCASIFKISSYHYWARERRRRNCEIEWAKERSSNEV